MSGIRIEPPALPLLPVPRLARRAAGAARAEALGAGLEPEQAWVAFRAAERRSPSSLLRLLARVDDSYRTALPEYLDRPDVLAPRRQAIIKALDRTNRALGTYPRLCRLLAPLVAGLERPRVLEVASGHGQLAIRLERTLAAKGLAAEVTGSDLAPELVALARQNGAKAGSAVRFEELDATRLALPDDSMDLVVNALSMHHLPFGMVVRALAEMRRVSRRAAVYDIWRAPIVFPPAIVVMWALSMSLDCTHDGIISMRKAWGVEEWYLAAQLAGWSTISIGLVLPSFLLIRFER